MLEYDRIDISEEININKTCGYMAIWKLWRTRSNCDNLFHLQEPSKLPHKPLRSSYYHYLTYLTTNYSNNCMKIIVFPYALTILKKVDAESLGLPPKFQVIIEIQLNTARVSRLSFRFL